MADFRGIKRRNGSVSPSTPPQELEGSNSSSDAANEVSSGSGATQSTEAPVDLAIANERPA